MPPSPASHLRRAVALLRTIRSAEERLRREVHVATEDRFAEAIAAITSNKRLLAEALRAFAAASAKKPRKLAKRRHKEHAREAHARNRAEAAIAEERVATEAARKEKNEAAAIQMECILKDGTRRKADARKYLQLLDAVSELRDARVKSRKGRGLYTSAEDTDEFSSSIAKLKNLWNAALCEYNLEEARLLSGLEVLDDCAANEEVKNKDGDEDPTSAMIDEWTTKCDSDLENFVCVRKQWDQYVSERGSTVPVGWVIPPKPSDGWKEYIRE